MDQQMKELIAIGASIGANCQPCLAYHVKKAKEEGASKDRIEQAIAVGKMVRKGAASQMDKFICTGFETCSAEEDKSECDLN